MPDLSRTASLKLNIVIVGGGVSGLAGAFRLTQAGHNVRLFEKSNPVVKSYGIRVPPNLTKILNEWGFGEHLARCGKPIHESQCFSAETGELLGHAVWQRDVLKEIGSQFLLMHYQDLHDILHSAAESVGVRMTYNTTVTKVLANPPRVELASGETVSADLIIGADGPESLVRETVEGKPNHGYHSEDDFSAYIATIPRERLKTDHELNAYTTPALGGPQYPLWMGTSFYALGFPVRDESEFAIIVFSLDKWMDKEGEELNPTIPGSKLRIPGETILRRLLDMCPTLQRTRCTKRDFPVEWVDNSRRIVLMGAAAHPSLPYLTQSASLDVEDAEILGWLLSRLHIWDELPLLLDAFQELRQDRCRVVHERIFEAFQTARLPPGPARDSRNAALRAIMTSGVDGWDEAKLRREWEELNEVLGYNAREAVENWWVCWGGLRERSQSVSLKSVLPGPGEQATQ